eukprot:TRINITY_DN1364_c0_g1_i1.p1 TRINITY_DN1364_c0_g1~~TRINITY_DN1364_c0_g1_i1.p1  ORF type:complete len:480 (+),score=223.17 TRINITY_DN1364_c0_g1_i1:42-1481(+)
MAMRALKGAKVRALVQGRRYNGNTTSQRMSKELETSVKTIMRDIVQPLDHWNLYGNVLMNKPSAPMVLLLGNHSAGKSTFINTLLGDKVQATGVAPTDDGFTLIKRGAATHEEDGPTLVGTHSHGFQELSTFGSAFVNLLRMKVRNVPETSKCPEDLILVDSPGMIGSPNGEGDLHDRGYDLLKVTRWFAERADCILIMFDPANPGTTGETLDVLTESLAELDHKFLIVMNKVDQFDNVADFARAYGALCWNLSKVVKRKDIPRIYTIFTPGTDTDGNRVQHALDNALPVKEFEKMQLEVVNEVLRAPGRQLDNMLTLLEQTTNKVYLTAKVAEDLRQQYASAKFRLRSLTSLTACAGVALSMTAASVPLMATGSVASLALAGAGEFATQRYLERYEKDLISRVDEVLVRYSPDSSEQLTKQKYAPLRTALEKHLAKVKLANLPRVSSRQFRALEKVMKTEVPQLREKARGARAAATQA